MSQRQNIYINDDATQELIIRKTSINEKEIKDSLFLGAFALNLGARMSDILS